MAKANPNGFLGTTAEIKTIFEKFDKNGDGKISSTELIESLRELGTHISVRGVDNLMKDIDKDGDGHINLEEFMEFVTANNEKESISKEIRDAFDLYDVDKNGLISKEELHKVMNMLGLKYTIKDCEKMIQGVDQDGDGHVNFEEFMAMMSRGALHGDC